MHQNPRVIFLALPSICFTLYRIRQSSTSTHSVQFLRLTVIVSGQKQIDISLAFVFMPLIFEQYISKNKSEETASKLQSSNRTQLLLGFSLEFVGMKCHFRYLLNVPIYLQKTVSITYSKNKVINRNYCKGGAYYLKKLQCNDWKTLLTGFQFVIGARHDFGRAFHGSSPKLFSIRPIFLFPYVRLFISYFCVDCGSAHR